MLNRTAFDWGLKVCNYILKNILSCMCSFVLWRVVNSWVIYFFVRYWTKRSVLCFGFELKLKFSATLSSTSSR